MFLITRAVTRRAAFKVRRLEKLITVVLHTAKEDQQLV